MKELDLFTCISRVHPGAEASEVVDCVVEAVPVLERNNIECVKLQELSSC